MPEMMIKEVGKKERSSSSTLTRHIVFVDDDEDELLIFNQAMKELRIPFNLQYAKNADTFFSFLQNEIPDLIFLDLHMPGKSGITVLKMLRFNNNYDTVPIIIYSKLSNPAFIDDCYQAKANYYLIKPGTLTKLSNAINRIIETNWNAERYPERKNFVIDE